MMSLKICVRGVAVGAAPRECFTHNCVVPGMCRIYLDGNGPILSNKEKRDRARRGGEQITIRSLINKLLAVGSPDARTALGVAPESKIIFYRGAGPMGNLSEASPAGDTMISVGAKQKEKLKTKSLNALVGRRRSESVGKRKMGGLGNNDLIP